MVSFSLDYASESFYLEDGTLIPENSFYLSKTINFSGSSVFVGFCLLSEPYDFKFEDDTTSFYCTLDKEKFLSLGHSFVSFSSSSVDEFSFSISPKASLELFELILLKNSSIGDFFLPSLDGSCGSFPDGTVVKCVGIEGDFVVAGSQFVWNDSTTQNSMILYKLIKGEKFCLAPAVYVTVKAS